VRDVVLHRSVLADRAVITGHPHSMTVGEQTRVEMG